MVQKKKQVPEHEHDRYEWKNSNEFALALCSYVLVIGFVMFFFYEIFFIIPLRDVVSEQESNWQDLRENAECIEWVEATIKENPIWCSGETLIRVEKIGRCWIFDEDEDAYKFYKEGCEKACNGTVEYNRWTIEDAHCKSYSVPASVIEK